MTDASVAAVRTCQPLDERKAGQDADLEPAFEMVLYAARAVVLAGDPVRVVARSAAISAITRDSQARTSRH